MSGISHGALRVGKRYRVTNFGDQYEIEIEEARTDGDFEVKDLHTLEHFKLSEIVKYGTGTDYEIRDLE
jgi:hypothetical protein